MTEPNPIVFVVDDDASLRDALKSLIRSVGLQVELFASAQEFLQRKTPDVPSCLVLDIRLPGISGLDFQRKLAEAKLYQMFTPAQRNLSRKTSAKSNVKPPNHLTH